jgi:hypothetical protein
MAQSLRGEASTELSRSQVLAPGISGAKVLDWPLLFLEAIPMHLAFLACTNATDLD